MNEKEIADRAAGRASAEPEGLREAAKDVIETMEKYPHAIPHTLSAALNNLARALAPTPTASIAPKGDVLPLAPECAPCAENADGRCCGTGECWTCPLNIEGKPVK